MQWRNDVIVGDDGNVVGREKVIFVKVVGTEHTTNPL